MTAMNDIIDKIGVLLPDMDICETETIKNNDSHKNGISIGKPGSNVNPIFYISEKELLCSTADDIAIKIVNQFNNDCRDNLYFDSFPNFIERYENIIPLLTIQLINHSMNKELLENIPSKRFLDFDIIVVIGIHIDDETHAVVKVSNACIDNWNMTFEEVYIQAYNNFIQDEYKLYNMMDLLKSFDSDIDICESFPMYVLTNEKKYHGAGYISSLYVMNSVSERLDSDLIVIPSSIHECIIMPLWNADLDQIDNIIKLVNVEAVEREEILSDHVYIYTRKDGWQYND